jgi:hypothetical protein
VQQPGRAFDVGEQEGDGAGREVSAHGGMMRQLEVPVTRGRAAVQMVDRLPG